MGNRKALKSLENLKRSIDRLGEALEEKSDNSLFIDGTIQRFEFTLELFWKTLKRLLETEGVETGTPKDTLKKAFAAGWLEDETAWLQMLKDRNETSHVYDEEKAMKIYQNIQTYFPELKKTYFYLKDKFADLEMNENDK